MSEEQENTGVEWYTVPSERKKWAMFRILRVPPGGKLIFTITSTQWIGCYTHWIAGRTQPHKSHSCEGCKGKTALRWKGWLSGVSEKNGEHAIIEFPEGSIYSIEEWFKRNGTLRGWACRMQRLNAKVNAKIAVTFAKSEAQVEELPEEPPIKEILQHMWEEGWDQVDKERASPVEMRSKHLDKSSFNGRE